ncbi:MAG: asparaginase [Clostridia bacterium]|nr:asparaginase [Clostridia bacterium]
MKIAVIFTGGTIGSRCKDEWIGVDPATRYVLLKPFENKGFDFIPFAPYTILSENLSATELNLLQDAVSTALADRPDGIIVTHGTDTLQYTAAALAYAFADTSVPIVLVSAAYPLEDQRTNGFANFEGALALMQSRPGGGVFVSYKNEREKEVTIHSATRLLQHAETSADVYSIDNAVFAAYKDGLLSRGSLPLPRGKGMGKIHYADLANVLVVESAPGNPYDYDLTQVRAILLKPYHSATLATENENLGKLCKEARDREIPVFLCSVRTGAAYESSKLFGSLGICIAPFSTFVALYMKVWAAISQNKKIPTAVQTQLADEWAAGKE